MFRVLLGFAILACGVFTVKTGVDTNPPYPHLVAIGAAMFVISMLLLFGPRSKD